MAYKMNWIGITYVILCVPAMAMVGVKNSIVYGDFFAYIIILIVFFLLTHGVTLNPKVKEKEE